MRMTILYHTAKFKSASIFISVGLDQTAKFEHRQYIQLYRKYSVLGTRYGYGLFCYRMYLVRVWEIEHAQLAATTNLK